MAKPEIKYDKEREYSGNCPFLRANREKYWEEKEKADALRKEEETAEG